MMTSPIVKRTLGLFLVLAAALGAAFSLADRTTSVDSQQRRSDNLIDEQLAYHIGMLAYLYGYPLVDMARQMHNETHRVSASQQVLAPPNRLYRYPGIVGPHNAGNLRAPNNDTLYFSGWFDISTEPLIIHTPDTGGRYYTIAVTNQYAEVEHIGRRTTGTAEGYFALVPPHWEGKLPQGVVPVPTETSRGWLLGRMYVGGSQDYPEAAALVENIWLASLGEFQRGRRPAVREVEAARPSDPLGTLEFFEVMNRVLKTLPPRPAEAALLAQFDRIGIGPNADFRADALAPARRAGLERALVDGAALVQASTRRTIANYNGWMMSTEIGRYGYDYLHRASVVAGGYGNLPEESLYPAAVFDAQGELLSGGHVYRLHFPAGQLPPVDGFWSIAAYRLEDKQFEENPIGRYSIGDRTGGLKYNEDGSLTLWLQHHPPQEGQTNWLPVPPGGFMVVCRLYEPHREAVDGRYTLPRLEKMD